MRGTAVLCARRSLGASGVRTRPASVMLGPGEGEGVTVSGMGAKRVQVTVWFEDRQRYEKAMRSARQILTEQGWELSECPLLGRAFYARAPQELLRA
jgi:hypothetical protein